MNWIINPSNKGILSLNCECVGDDAFISCGTIEGSFGGDCSIAASGYQGMCISGSPYYESGDPCAGNNRYNCGSVGVCMDDGYDNSGGWQWDTCFHFECGEFTGGCDRTQ